MNALQLPIPRCSESVSITVDRIDSELLRKLLTKIHNMTDKEEDEDVPSFRGIELVLLALEQISADESYRTEFIAELCKRGLAESVASKAAVGVFFDPKVSPIESAQAHLDAEEMCKSLRCEDVLVIKQ